MLEKRLDCLFIHEWSFEWLRLWEESLVPHVVYHWMWSCLVSVHSFALYTKSHSHTEAFPEKMWRILCFSNQESREENSQLSPAYYCSWLCNICMTPWLMLKNVPVMKFCLYYTSWMNEKSISSLVDMLLTVLHSNSVFVSLLPASLWSLFIMVLQKKNIGQSCLFQLKDISSSSIVFHQFFAKFQNLKSRGGVIQIFPAATCRPDSAPTYLRL